MWDYTDKVKEYFMHPKNVGVITDADAVGDVGSITCGDALKLMLKVEEGTEKIIDAKLEMSARGRSLLRRVCGLFQDHPQATAYVTT